MRITREGLPLVLLLAAAFAPALSGCGGRTLRGGDGAGDEDGGDGGESFGQGGDHSVEPGGRGGKDSPGFGGGWEPGAGGRRGTPSGAGGRPVASGGSPSVGGGVSPPGCSYGQTVICRCTDELYGAMECLRDRSGYAPCVCDGQGPLCYDGILDGRETDTDCGGGVCQTCGDGYACLDAGDCMSGLCLRGYCTSR